MVRNDGSSGVAEEGPIPEDQIVVGEETLAKTSRCQRRFVCLSGELYCSVVACMDERLHFILCKADIDCVYKGSSGGHAICACPTRAEIHHRYRL